MQQKITEAGNDSRRITVIDAMRGIALVGICLAHAVQYFGVGAPPANPPLWSEGLDEAVRWFVRYFVASKFYIIFSLLFGLSFFIQMDRAAQKGIDFRRRFFWRLVLLLVIGGLHSVVFRSDILSIYALLGFPLVLMYKLPTKWLVGISLFLLLGGVQLGVVGCKALKAKELPAAEVSVGIRLKPLPRATSFGEMAVQNMTSGLERKMNYQLQSGRLFMTMGLFIVGLLVGRVRLFQRLDDYRWRLYRGAGVAVLLLAALYAVRPYLPHGAPDTLAGWVAQPVENVINFSSAYLWMVLIVWAYRAERVQRALSPLVSYGRMGLTNYIVQSVVGVLLFVSFGLGLGQYAGFFLASVICMGYTVLQVAGSHWWLRRFRYGPLEWLWRSGTYMKWQALRK